MIKREIERGARARKRKVRESGMKERRKREEQEREARVGRKREVRDREGEREGVKVEQES